MPKLRHPFYWKPIKLSDVEPGDIISRKMSNYPRLVVAIEVNDSYVMVYVKNEYDKKNYKYIESYKNDQIDILFNIGSNKKATYEEAIQPW